MPEPQERTDKTEARALYCKLTQAEFIVRATEFAKLEGDVDDLEARRKASNQDFKNQIGGVNARRSVLRRAVTERRELREVQCTWHADWASKSMLLRRDDSGEVIEARTMTADEVQRGFDFTPDGKQLPEQTDDSEPLDA